MEKSKKIFAWVMLVLCGVACGCLLGSWFVNMKPQNASAEIVSTNALSSDFSSFTGSALGATPNDNGYFTNYSVYTHYYQGRLLSFNFASMNRVYTNQLVAQYALGNTTQSTAPIYANSWNNTGFVFDVPLNTMVLNSANLLASGDVKPYYVPYSSNNVFTGYTLDSTSSHYAVGCKYYLYSSCNSQFDNFVGYTFGNFFKSSNSSLGNWEDFTNLSQFADIALDNFNIGSWFYISLFDSSFNRLTLFVQVSSSTSQFINASSFYPKQVFFSDNISADLDKLYDSGFEAGRQYGYGNGYNDGVNASNNYSFLSLIGAVVDAPIQAFTGLFNFEILGVNLKDFLAGLFTICIVIMVVRYVMVK